MFYLGFGGVIIVFMASLVDMGLDNLVLQSDNLSSIPGNPSSQMRGFTTHAHEGCKPERILFTIYSCSLPPKHLWRNLSFDRTDFLVGGIVL